MSDVTCLDAVQLAALIFGAIFGTLALCVGFGLTVLYFATNRQCQFAQKVPGLEKIISLGEKCCAKSKKNGANSNNFMPNSKIHSELTTNSFENNKPNQTTVIQQQQPTPTKTTKTNHQQQNKEKSQTTVSRMDSMEEISLTDHNVGTAANELCRVEKKFIDECEAPPPQPPAKSPPPISEYFDAQSTVTAEHHSGNIMVENASDLLRTVSDDAQQNDSNSLPSKMNDPSMLATDTDEQLRENKFDEETPTVYTYNKNNNGMGAYGITDSDKSNGTICLTQEQCNVLEANRQKLEAERQQLRQLGII